MAARFTHILRDWPLGWVFSEEPLDPDQPSLEVSQAIDIVAYQDPLSELHLSASWPSMSEELIADSQFHSDLDPLQAPNWTLYIKRSEKVSTSLQESLLGFFNLSNCPVKDHQILGKLIEDLEDKENDLEVRQALDRMSNPSLSINLPQLGQVRGNWKWRVPQAVRTTLLKYIFEDSNQQHNDDDISDLLKDFRTFKSCKFDGLAWRIVLTLAYVNAAFKDMASLAFMWREIISELRKFWEKCQQLPR